MVSIGSKARSSEYNASILTSGSVLAAVCLCCYCGYILCRCAVRRMKLVSMLG